MVKKLIAVAAAIIVLLAPQASSMHQAAHVEPVGPAAVRFPTAFRGPNDAEWGFPLGGFGGKLGDDAEWDVTHAAKPERHHPVIFVHGNTVDAADWYPVRDTFVGHGWNALDVWALSYNGLGSQNGADSIGNPRRDDEHLNDPDNDFAARVTNNSVNKHDLYKFIVEVRRFRKQPRFSIVAHSLGVTVARNMLKVYPQLRKDLVAFVGIAGGNHGTSLCPPGTSGNLYSCDELERDSPWLAKLNGPGGRDETFAPARFMTVYDGSGSRDAGYLGPDYAQSPVLRGAVNCAFEESHNNLRLDPRVINVYRKFVELAERGITDDDCR
jgi:pimeloyl-ACP methyl ester carboxylesterase